MSACTYLRCGKAIHLKNSMLRKLLLIVTVLFTLPALSIGQESVDSTDKIFEGTEWLEKRMGATNWRSRSHYTNQPNLLLQDQS